jgi:hypothetical protein
VPSTTSCSEASLGRPCSRLRPSRRLIAVCARSRRPHAPERPSKHDQPHGLCRRLERATSGQQKGSKRSKSSLCNLAQITARARRPASIERLRVNRRQSSSSWNKPVTPEVAGSSPVAPVSSSTCKRASSVASIGGIRGSRRRRLLPEGSLVLSSFRENDLQRGQFRALESRWCSGQPRKAGHSPARRLSLPRLAVSDEIFLRLLGLGMATAIFRQSPHGPGRTGSACPWGRRWRCAASPLRGGAMKSCGSPTPCSAMGR